MNDFEYVRFLMESAFKESERFWIRNNGFLVLQSILTGFAFSIIVKGIDAATVVPILIFSGFGTVIAIFHFLVILVSSHYNRTWFDTAAKYVDVISTDNTNPDSGKWKSFYSFFIHHESRKPLFNLNSTDYAKIIPAIFLMLWLALGYLAGSRGSNKTLKWHSHRHGVSSHGANIHR